MAKSSKTITVLQPLKPVVIALAANSAKKIADANYRLGMEHNTWIGIVGRELKSVKESMDSNHHYEEWVLENLGWSVRHANEILMARSMQDVFVEKGVENLPSSISQYRELARFGSNDIALERWVGFQKTGIKSTQENIKNFVGQSLIETTKKPKGSNGKRIAEEVVVHSVKDAPSDQRRIGVDESEDEVPEYPKARGLSISVPKVDVTSVNADIEEARRVDPPTISQMPIFESDEETWKRLSLDIGKERVDELYSELFGETADSEFVEALA